MKYPGLIISRAIIITISLLLSGGLQAQSTDLEYEGKSLDGWMDDFTNSFSEDGTAAENFARQQKWTNIVNELGVKGLPEYIEGIKDTDYPGRNYASGIAFEILGPAAEPAIPDLVRLLAEDKTAGLTLPCLVAIGPKSIPALTNAAATLTNAGGRYVAVCALGQFGTAAEAAVPTLTQIIKTNPALAGPGMRILVEVATNAEAFIPLFVAHVTDSNGAGGAAYALGRIGEPGIPYLLNALTNDTRAVRAFAAGALDPEFLEVSRDRKQAPARSFLRISTLYNLKVVKAASRFYAVGDYRSAAQIADEYLNHTNPQIRLFAKNAADFLAPLARTNVPRAQIDATNESY